MGQLSGKAIAALLISSNSLQFLSIAGHNNIGDVGLQAIAAALHENVSLKSLDISGIGCTSSGLHRLAAALAENDAITSLNCNGTTFTRVLGLCCGVYVCCGCVILPAGNNISHLGARSLGAVLRAHKSLATVHLEGNCVGVTGALHISNALRTSPALTCLSLDGNNIGPDGCKSLCDALKDQSVLRQLSLNGTAVLRRVVRLFVTL
jgi:Ran GTPase-activating protein (RanGAP) involved in mRNA processing and transport